MAKDDYHVIVYQILSYLYQCLKSGLPIDESKLYYDSKMINVNKRYWEYIIASMIDMGLVDGTYCRNLSDGTSEIMSIDKMQITPKGIEYLCDNSFLAKAKAFVQDTIGVISPFF
ncbi:MAG: YjcQ family protein [Eubacteriales bacterium]|nr:YjcQ family protein [Eubacteriales bacterium]